MSLERHIKERAQAHAISIAHAVPGLVRRLLKVWTKLSRWSRKPPRWLIVDLANAVDYRAEVEVRLGNGLPVRVVANDIVGEAICTHGWFEPDTVRLLDTLIRPRDTFVDIGAHVGQYTLLASRRAHRVIAFEPDPATFRMLSHNVFQNGLTNVVLSQAAVANASGSQSLHLSASRNIGANSLMPLTGSVDSGRTVKVACWSLDDYMRTEAITSVDLLKIDAEGAEPLILEGFRGGLQPDTQPILIMELYDAMLGRVGSSCSALTAKLRSLGYRLWTVGPLPLKEYQGPDPIGRAFNILAVPQRRLSDVLPLVT